MHFAFTTMGEMSIAETCKEFPRDTAVPLLVCVQGERRFIPAFHAPETCRNFCRRNFPKEWVSGQVILPDEDVETLKQSGFEIEVFGFPKLLKDRVTFEAHIHFLVDVDPSEILAVTQRHGIIRRCPV